MRRTNNGGRHRLYIIAGLLLALSGELRATPADGAASQQGEPAFAATIANKAPATAHAPPGMVWIPGGEFSMGCKEPSTDYCTMATMNAANDAQPIHRVYVDGFWMDRTDVTNEEFAKFVQATGYVTVAERTPQRSGGGSGGRFACLHTSQASSATG
jgi:formylglycine-generating enzyme required for sulfatase activity